MYSFYKWIWTELHDEHVSCAVRATMPSHLWRYLRHRMLSAVKQAAKMTQ